MKKRKENEVRNGDVSQLKRGIKVELFNASEF